MDEFLELKKQCKQHKIKNILRYSVYFIAIIFVALVLYFLLSKNLNTQQKPSKKIEKNTTTSTIIQQKQPEQKKEKEIVPKIVKNPIPEEHIENLKPQIEVKEIKVEEEKTIEPMLNLEGINEQIAPVKPKKETKPSQTKQIIKEHKQINIQKTQEKPKPKEEIIKKEDIKEFLKSTNIDPNQAYRNYMQKALKYFREENYNEAIKYSIKANKIKKYAAEPWIIFAQSKYKLGQKDEAIKVLENYLLFRDNAKIRQIKEKMEKYK